MIMMMMMIVAVVVVPVVALVLYLISFQVIDVERIVAVEQYVVVQCSRVIGLVGTIASLVVVVVVATKLDVPPIIVASVSFLPYSASPWRSQKWPSSVHYYYYCYFYFYFDDS